MTRTFFALLAAVIFAALSVLSFRLVEARRRLGVVRDLPAAALRASAAAAAAAVLPYLAVEGTPGALTSGALAGVLARLSAWLPLYLLLVAQAAFLRRNRFLPAIWLLSAFALLALTLPPALASR